MTTHAKKNPAPGTKPRQKTGAAKSAAADKTPIRKVPSPDEVAPKSVMNPLPKSAKSAVKSKGDEPEMGGPVMKKQELIQKVVTRSGIKKKDAKPVVAAMLEVLGESLAEGRELNLQPMGKLKLNRTKETPKARIIVCKIRQSKRLNKDSLTLNPGVAATSE